MRKKIIIGIAVVFAGFLIWRIAALVVSGGKGQTGRGSRPPVAVEVDSIRIAPIRDVRTLTGTVYPNYRYVIAPKIAGRLITLRPRIGDWVAAGEVIGALDDAEYEQSVIEADANLRIARASLAETSTQFELARQEKERVETLQAKGIASPSELDAAVSTHAALASRLDLATAQVEQREAALQSARIRRSYARLSVSRPGFVGERFVDPGALLAPNTPVLSVVSIDSVIVQATVTERDYGHLRPGQTAEVMVDAFPSRRFVGTVARVSPVLQEASRVAQVEVVVENDSLHIKPGMFARVEVVIAQRDAAQVVPAQALVVKDGQAGLFVVPPDTMVARYVPITTGIRTATHAEVTEPTIEGLVVTLGHHLLEDGGPVMLPAEGEPTGSGITRRKPR